LKPRSILCGLGQTTGDLRAREPHIPQLSVRKTPQSGQGCLAFTLRDNGSDEVIDDPKNAAREKSY
jgi:hypothetical protein